MEKVISFFKNKPSSINPEKLRKIACSKNQASLRKPAPLFKNEPSAAITQKFSLVHHFRSISKVFIQFLENQVCTSY